MSLDIFVHVGKFQALYVLDNLTYWGRVTHICVGKLTIIASDNGLSPGPRQTIIWTNAAKLLIGPLRTNFNEILIEIHTFSFKKMHLKMSSAKWRPFCLGLNITHHMHTEYKISVASKPNNPVIITCMWKRRYEVTTLHVTQLSFDVISCQSGGMMIGDSNQRCHEYCIPCETMWLLVHAL